MTSNRTVIIVSALVIASITALNATTASSQVLGSKQPIRLGRGGETVFALTDGGNIPAFDPANKWCADTNVKYLRFHIEKGFFGSLSLGHLCGVANSCWRDAKAGATQDDDGKDYDVIPPPYAPVSHDVDWDTPLDVTVTPYFPKYDVVQIKIILDSPNVNFVSKQGSPGEKDPSAEAVKQGTNGNGMFLCRSQVISATDGTNTKWITVRVIPAKKIPGYDSNNKPYYGGLNIGILVPVDRKVLPLYIDPKVPNDG